MYVFKNEQDNTVSRIVYMESILTDEEKSLGVQVNSIPEPNDTLGKIPVLRINNNNGLYYEYVDRQLTKEEKSELKLQGLQEEDLNNKEAIAELYMLTLGV